MKDILKQIFGAHWSDDPETLKIYGRDWTTYFTPQPAAVVFPTQAAQIQELIRAARTQKWAVVPSGGRTGLSGGAVATKGEVVLSLEKMNRISDYNEFDLSLRAEAGAVTDAIKEFAKDKGFFFPVAFASSGSSQIGGNLATNAGGVNVLRYGLTRNWVSGVEVVLGTGELVSFNQGLVKNATGYDFRHLLIGSEGTLGIITASELQLTRLPVDTQVLLLAIPGWEEAMKIFSKARRSLSLLAFEIFDRKALEKVMLRSEAAEPFGAPSPFHLVLEIERESEKTADILNRFVDEIFADGLASDGVFSQSEAQARDLWAFRENISESIAPFKPYKNDISVKSSKIPEFVKEIESKISAAYPDFEVLWFGHIGDGNLHINVLKPDALAIPEFVNHCRTVDRILFEAVQKFRGSISAEHGVGLTKKDFLKFTRSEVEIQLMRSVKKIFDPDGILNPGKIFD